MLFGVGTKNAINLQLRIALSLRHSEPRREIEVVQPMLDGLHLFAFVVVVKGVLEALNHLRIGLVVSDVPPIGILVEGREELQDGVVDQIVDGFVDALVDLDAAIQAQSRSVDDEIEVVPLLDANDIDRVVERQTGNVNVRTSVGQVHDDRDIRSGDVAPDADPQVSLGLAASEEDIRVLVVALHRHVSIEPSNGTAKEHRRLNAVVERNPVEGLNADRRTAELVERPDDHLRQIVGNLALASLIGKGFHHDHNAVIALVRVGLQVPERGRKDIRRLVGIPTAFK